jgi:hypothetical protein
MANTKGTVILPMVKALRWNPAGRSLVPQHLQHYLQDRILVSKWYPSEDYRDLLIALGNSLGNQEGTWEFLGASIAQLELTGVYKSLLRENNPVGSLRSLSGVWKVQQDTGRIDVTVSAQGQVCIELIGFTIVAREVCATYTGYIAEMIRLASGDPTGLRKQQCTARGDRACVWYWDAPMV